MFPNDPWVAESLALEEAYAAQHLGQVEDDS